MKRHLGGGSEWGGGGGGGCKEKRVSTTVQLLTLIAKINSHLPRRTGRPPHKPESCPPGLTCDTAIKSFAPHLSPGELLLALGDRGSRIRVSGRTVPASGRNARGRTTTTKIGQPFMPTEKRKENEANGKMCNSP
jgi:hypothetical protein